ncbi:MAG: tetratricopeptide repeat protein [Proteobacteria bacterium]|nr:MAG: tetratricopeptide repeat protein [Pseudomonadota bacterium]
MPLLIIFFALALSSCSTLFEEPSPTGEITSNKSPQAKVAPVDALELRVAQLWSKVDDLETQLLQQKERTKLLERGLLLGIVPDELKTEDERPTPAKLVKEKEQEIKGNGTKVSDADSKLQVALPPAAAKAEGSHDREQYRKLLQAAQDKFNRANYGQAIVAFNDIGAKFDDSVTEGSHHYWVGLSWFYLKEYQLAEESFKAFRDRYPSNPWNEHAAFYLAKIELSRGLTQRALDQFQKILDNNPDRDLGEMARAEIQRMKEKL